MSAPDRLGGVPTEDEEWEIAKASLELPPLGAGPEIPKILHRFWSFGPMRQGAFDILQDSARAAKHGWTLLLWSSRILEEACSPDRAAERDAQRTALVESGYSIRYVEDLLSDPKLAFSEREAEIVRAAARLAARRPDAEAPLDNLRYFSDLARLLLLKAIGGLYLDVDIGLGEMDLDRTLRHNDPAGEVPLAGAVGKNQEDSLEVAEDLAAVHEARSRGEVEREALCRLAEQAQIRAMGLNAALASRPGTRHLGQALSTLLSRVAVAEDVLPPGTALQPILLLGRAALPPDEPETMEALDARTAALYDAARLAVPPYFARLDQLSAESVRPSAPPRLAGSMLVYIAAHPDDWVLFGGERVFEALRDPAGKVVLIFTTAGDAGRTDDGFWEDRERAALSAVRAALPPCPLTMRLASPNGHCAVRYRCGGAVIWCLRLPDGSPDGSGFRETGRTSLKLLREKGRPIRAVDRSTSYTGWDDLCATLSAIVEEERAEVAPGGETSIHASDPSEATNPHDHADHIATAEAALALRGDGLRYVWWRTYSTAADPPNLAGPPAAQKKALFEAYVRELARLTALSGEPVEIGDSEWDSWGERSYCREAPR
ncbi:MAG: PIG-L family deacetylase [Polyangiaceae bacterium]